MTDTATVFESAPAKINLALHVTGQRDDGYHLLDTLVVFTEVGDRLSFAPAQIDQLIVKGRHADALAGEDPSSNLVWKAMAALRAHGLKANAPCPPVCIELEKNLPVASGIGGGSSDAAAALRGLIRLWKLVIAPNELSDLALSLGADVPMCLIGKPLFVKGIGEDVAPAINFPALHLVLLNPGVAIATPDIFKALAKKSNKPLTRGANLSAIHALREWLSAQRNDLQEPALALQPVIREALAALHESGALVARMSGSGATCFGIFSSEASAAQASKAIFSKHRGWFVVATKSSGS